MSYLRYNRMLKATLTIMSNTSFLPSSDETLLPIMQPSVRELLPNKNNILTDFNGVIAKLVGFGMNRPGMLDEAIKLVERTGAKIVSAMGGLEKNGLGRIEVMYFCTHQQYGELIAKVEKQLRLSSVDIYEVPCRNPTTVVVTVMQQEGFEGEVTEVLANMQCDVIQTFSSVCLQKIRSNKTLLHSFACLVSRPQRVNPQYIEFLLEPMAERRDGIVMVRSGCLKLTDHY